MRSELTSALGVRCKALRFAEVVLDSPYHSSVCDYPLDYDTRALAGVATTTAGDVAVRHVLRHLSDSVAVKLTSACRVVQVWYHASDQPGQLQKALCYSG
jgi:hypothetical protein